MKEDRIQMQVVEFFRSLEDKIKTFTFFSVPNEGFRRNGERYKAMGMRAGVADLVFLLDGGEVIFIELKRAGEGLTGKQPEWHELVIGLGYHVYMVAAETGKEAARDILILLQGHGLKFHTSSTAFEIIETWSAGYDFF